MNDRTSPTYPPGHDGRWTGPLLRDRIGVVTGGAGAVAGATCALFADHGADVVVVDNAADRTAAAVADAAQPRRRALGVPCDPTADGSSEHMTGTVLEAFGRVDMLANAMGHAL